MIEKVVPFVHTVVRDYISKNDIVIDMTMGNGNDTLFLSLISKHVYSFDVLDQAINSTKELLEQHFIDNVTLIKDTHLNVDLYVQDKVSCILFNLGYLPGGDKNLTTKPTETIEALEKALVLLNNKGIISITVYPGHENGKIESELLLNYVTSLSSKDYNVVTYKFINKNNSPYNIFIEKN